MRCFRAKRGLKDFSPSFKIILVSLALGFLVWFLFVEFTPKHGEIYGVLTVDTEFSDRAIGERLRNAGFPAYFSESSVKVYFDDFGRWKEFYLDEYRNHIEPFDPRDDGYAEKLRSFFVNNGKRSFFVSLGDSVRPRDVQKTIARTLNSIPFSFEILAPPEPLLFWFILQSAAAAFILVISKEKRRFIFAVPVILGFSAAGLPGTVLAGILSALWELLREPVRELLSGRPYGNPRERFGPYRRILRWVFALVFLYGLFSAVLEVPAVPAAAGFLGFSVIIFLAFNETNKSGRGRFIPVVILPFRQKAPRFHQAMAVFACAALAGSLLAAFLPGLPRVSAPGILAAAPAADVLTADEYREHMAFQASFSYTPLGSAGREYRRYVLGADGLIAGAGNSVTNTNMEFPPFPLERLTAFLLNYESSAGENSRLFAKEWFSMALMVLLLVPSWLRPVRKSGKNKKDNLFLVRMRTAA